jgi:hypothetical protein
MPALCPNCEHWQPVVDPVSADVVRRCVAGIDGAPKIALCDKFLRSAGRGEILDWVEPPGDKN